MMRSAVFPLVVIPDLIREPLALRRMDAQPKRSSMPDHVRHDGRGI